MPSSERKSALGELTPRNRRLAPSPWLLLATLGIPLALWGLAVGATEVVLDDGSVGDPARGRHLYQRYCATCHGDAGDGAGPTARYLGDPQPADFTRGVFKFRSTYPDELPTHDDLARTIRRGVPGTRMPAFGAIMGNQQVADLVSHVESFWPGFSALGEGSPDRVPLPEAMAEASPAHLSEGRAVFLLAQCWTCHGVDGDGDGPEAAAQRDDWGAELAPRDLNSDPMHGGDQPSDLYRTLATGFDGTTMEAFLDDPYTLARPLVLHRDRYADGLTTLEGLTEADHQAIQTFVDALPTPDDFEDMGDEEQEALVAAWGTALTHYLHDLGQPNALDRILGLQVGPPLFGPASE